MELSKRILEILEKSGLTPSEFADKIDVQRSAISHITSGRNKPSLEFLIKIKKVFPEIDTDWLVFGIEKEVEIEQNPENKESINNNAPTLFDFDEVDEILEKEQTTEKEILKTPKNGITNSISSKKIKKIAFFYDDGTFDDFSENQN